MPDPNVPVVATAAGPRGASAHPRPAVVLAQLWSGWAVRAAAALFAFLAAGAAVDGGSVLLWDEPVARALDRPSGVAGFFRAVTVLGSAPVALALGALTALGAWRRCRAVAWAILFVSAVRPLLQWGLKELIDRPRPDFAPLTAADGPAFPSGHTMTAVVGWGLLVLVVALYTERDSVRLAAGAGAALAAALVAASRVVLGVHWLSDVVGGLLAGLLLLVLAERIAAATHDETCPSV